MSSRQGYFGPARPRIESEYGVRLAGQPGRAANSTLTLLRPARRSSGAAGVQGRNRDTPYSPRLRFDARTSGGFDRERCLRAILDVHQMTADGVGAGNVAVTRCSSALTTVCIELQRGRSVDVNPDVVVEAVPSPVGKRRPRGRALHPRECKPEIADCQKGCSYQRPWRVGEFRSAIDQNDVPRVRQMLGEGMDANLVFSQRDSERPLHAAAAWAGPEIIDLLIEAGANPLFGIRWDAFRSFPLRLCHDDRASGQRELKSAHSIQVAAALRGSAMLRDHLSSASYRDGACL
jgi:hypothetical protein